MKTNIQYIDLFAGAGGLSEGFKRTGKYNSIAHVEMNKHACDTLKTRLAYYYLRENNSIESYYKYLKKEISRDELWTLIPDAIL